MLKLVKCFIVFYILASATMSIFYNVFPSLAEEISFHRNGLIVAAVDSDEIWVLNPFSNFTDDWM